MHQDVVLYFVDESRAEEALQAGATYAGGIDLISKVRIHIYFLDSFVSDTPDRYYQEKYNRQRSFRLPPSSQ